jgi:hypothetical protein
VSAAWVDSPTYRQHRKDRRTMALAIALPLIVGVPWVLGQLAGIIPS